MIARYQHIIKGNEYKNALTRIQTPAIGLKTLNIIVSGVSYREVDEMNEATGVLTLPFEMEKGDSVVVLYKVIPRNGAVIIPSGAEFDSEDFTSDFVI